MNGLIDTGDIFIATTFIVMLVGLINLKTLKRFLPLRVLLCLISASLIFDIVGTLMLLNGTHNIWLINLYSLTEYLLLALFYFTLFKFNSNWKSTLGLFYALVLIVMTIIAIAQSFTEHINSLFLGVKSIIFICSSVIYFKLMLDKIEFDTPWSNPFFWINSAIIIYFSGCFFIFIFSEYRDVSKTINLWDIHNIIHIIYNLLILIGFWKARKA